MMNGLRAARTAARSLSGLAPETSAAVLRDLADRTVAATESLLDANRLDLARMDPANPKYDRLLLNPERLEAIAGDLRKVADLPCPLGEVLEQRLMDNGLQLQKLRVPVGVIGLTYGATPGLWKRSAVCRPR